MSEKIDDLEAVRVLVDTLGNFDAKDQERIIRWAREKLGLHTLPPPDQTHHQAGSTEHHRPPGQGSDIKTFVSQKNPTSDTQFAATVAYYYRFEAPQNQRKDTITAEDLQDACRKAGRERLKIPGQTLRNAVGLGLLDKGSERGTFTINTVGENLVAMTLPSKNTESANTNKSKPHRTGRKGNPKGTRKNRRKSRLKKSRP